MGIKRRVLEGQAYGGQAGALPWESGDQTQDSAS